MLTLARETLNHIAWAVAYDQGARFRENLKKVIGLADDAYRGEEDPVRSHMGGSVIGRECNREVWYSFHWVTIPSFEGRMIRLFNRGHLEEPRFVALLMTIGCTVYQYDGQGKQFRVSDHGGHFQGSLDSVLTGVPDMPQVPLLGEFKTHNDKSFQTLIASGVRQSKWEHFIQMNQYMGYSDLTHALYLAVNKNTDELYGEIVAFDPIIFNNYKQRALSLIQSDVPPKRISESQTFFKCKMCSHHKVCHLKDMPARNCRTCVFSRPIPTGEWVCQHPIHNVPLSKQDQMAGCNDYEMIQQIKTKP